MRNLFNKDNTAIFISILALFVAVSDQFFSYFSNPHNLSLVPGNIECYRVPSEPNSLGLEIASVIFLKNNGRKPENILNVCFCYSLRPDLSLAVWESGKSLGPIIVNPNNTKAIEINNTFTIDDHLFYDDYLSSDGKAVLSKYGNSRDVFIGILIDYLDRSNHQKRLKFPILRITADESGFFSYRQLSRDKTITLIN